jgi:hypothetical protein
MVTRPDDGGDPTFLIAVGIQIVGALFHLDGALVV